MSKPLLSVWCSTYNHEKYIAQALDGFVSQITDFEIEILVHDDASTDGTSALILDYSSRFPKIKPILLTENKFSIDKCYLNRRMFQEAKGKYIAMCEGDDYWTNPLKLQKQVDFLERNPDFNICFHSVGVLKENHLEKSAALGVPVKEISTFEDLAQRNYIHTVSCVFRNGLYQDFPTEFSSVAAGDYPLQLLNAKSGKIRYFDDVMAVYRIHPGGVWSLIDDEEQRIKWLKVLEACRDYFAPQGCSEFNKQIADSKTGLCFYSFRKERYSEFRKSFMDLLRQRQVPTIRSFNALLIRYIASFDPRVARLYSKMAGE